MIPDSVVPIIYAVMAAAFFGGQVVLTMRSLSYADAQTASMISMGTVVLVFWMLAPLMLKAEHFKNPGVWVFAGNGVIHPLISIYLAYEAARRMGPTISATLSAIAPLFATAGAVLALGEKISLPLLTGTLGTVAGIMVLSWRRQGAVSWALSSLFFPIGAAAIRAANHNIGKFGLQMLPSPYFAGLVSFTVSFVGAVIIYRYRIGRLSLNFPAKGLIWGGLAGLSISGGVLSMYSALNRGRVVVVSPIIAAFPLFTLVFSLISRQESLNLRVLFGVFLVVVGVVWISVQ
jgi:drug/metabolite transporter (DMT)-like permease